MSVYVIARVWDHSTAKGNDLLVQLALADNADQERSMAWPSVDLIAAKARVDRRTAQRCLRRLEDTGEVVLVRAGGRTTDGYRSAVYRVTPGQGRQDAPPAEGATPEAPRGDRNASGGVTATPPQPLKEPSTTVQGSPADSVESASRLDAAVVGELFDYWRGRCDHPQAKLTRDRAAKVRARLREGYTPEQIRAAIDGARRGAFVNDDGKRFDDLELICRSGSKLEGFISRPAANGSATSRGAPSTGSAMLRDMAAQLRRDPQTIDENPS